jgi:hypothetical protein
MHVRPLLHRARGSRSSVPVLHRTRVARSIRTRPPRTRKPQSPKQVPVVMMGCWHLQDEWSAEWSARAHRTAERRWCSAAFPKTTAGACISACVPKLSVRLRATGRFQSGQMGQTVNLLVLPSMVRIHPYPPLRIPRWSHTPRSGRAARRLPRNRLARFDGCRVTQGRRNQATGGLVSRQAGRQPS